MNLGWLQGLIPDPRGQARPALEQRYREEASEVELLKKLARAMKYPQDQAQLLSIGERKHQHLGQLETLILHFGGSVPSPEPANLHGKSIWETLSNALKAEVYDVESYHELRDLLQEDPNMVALLEKIVETERSNKNDLREVMAKLDPNSYGSSD